MPAVPHSGPLPSQAPLPELRAVSGLPLTQTEGRPALEPTLGGDQLHQASKPGTIPALGLTLSSPLTPTPLKRKDLQWIEGSIASWGSSGSHLPGKTTFSDWVMGSTGYPLPSFNKQLLLNCSEFVFYAALKAGKIDQAWLKQWNLQRNYTEPFEKFMLPAGAKSIDYQVRNGKFQGTSGPRPAEGDVVLFDGASHVMLATGRQIDGKTEVLSFSPLPLWGDGAFTMGKEGVAPERTTVEDLIQNLVDLYPDSPVDWANIQIRFGPAPWVVSQ